MKAEFGSPRLPPGRTREFGNARVQFRAPGGGALGGLAERQKNGGREGGRGWQGDGRDWQGRREFRARSNSVMGEGANFRWVVMRSRRVISRKRRVRDSDRKGWEAGDWRWKGMNSAGREEEFR